MFHLLQDSFNTYSKKFNLIVWPTLLFVGFLAVVTEMIKLNMSWISFGGGFTLMTGGNLVASSVTASVFGVIFLLFMLFSSIVLYAKSALDVAEIRKFSPSDFNIGNLLINGFYWILLFLFLYIPTVLLSMLILPSNVYIYSQPFNLPLLEGMILILSQLVLIMWAMLSAYIIAISDKEKPFSKLISGCFDIIGHHFDKLVILTILVGLIAFPFYAIPAGFGWRIPIFIVLYCVFGLPISAIFAAKSMNDFIDKEKINEKMIDDVIMNSKGQRNGVDDVLDKVADVFSKDDTRQPWDYKAVYVSDQPIYTHIDDQYNKEDRSVMDKVKSTLNQNKNEYDGEVYRAVYVDEHTDINEDGEIKKPEENKSILEQAGDKVEEIVDDVKDLVNSSESLDASK